MHRSVDEITSIVVHCSDTPNGSAAFGIADIDRWHKKRGFSRSVGMVDLSTPYHHVGYHYVIHINGDTVIGRGITEMGSHARGFNWCSVGVCMVGLNQFTAQQWEALRRLVVSLEAMAAPGAIRVLGHRDVNDLKTCPGFDVNQWRYLNAGAPMENHICKVK